MFIVTGLRVRDTILSITTCGDGGQVLHLERWDQGRFSIFCYVKHTKAVSLLDRQLQAILTGRPMSAGQSFQRD